MSKPETRIRPEVRMTQTPNTTVTRRFVVLAAALGVLSAWAGCGDGKGRHRATTSPATAPADTAPDIPDMDMNAGAADGPLVKAGPTKRPTAYALDEKVDTGALRVVCRIPSIRVTLPELKVVDFKGAYAIRNPKTVEPYKVIYNGISQKGYDIANELEFYKNWNPPLVETPLRWLHPAGEHMAVEGAAIAVEGIKAGPREELTRGSALINHKYTRINYIQGRGNYSGYNISFIPPDERVVLRSGDHFPCEAIVERHPAGERIGKPWPVPALRFKREGMYAGWLLRANPGSATQPWPASAPSPTLREKGVYRMRCLRHAWHVGYAVVADNPYVAVSGAQKTPWYSRDGKVTLDRVPVGTWKVRIGHPLIAPVQEVHEVKIERDETAYLIVEFKPPAELLKLVK